MSDELDETLDQWFGLSHASFLTMPRVLMNEMPDEWKGKMAALLTEFDDEFPQSEIDLGTRVQCTRGGKLVATPEALISYRRPDAQFVESCRQRG